MNRRKILIVEDDSSVADDLRTLVRELGHSVVEEAPIDGADAAEAAHPDAPELILLNATTWSREAAGRNADLLHQTHRVPVLLLGADPDGSPIVAAENAASVVRLPATATSPMLRTAIDLTCRCHEAEKKLQRIERLLASAPSPQGDSLAVLVGSIAHNFNNLLSTIVGNTQLTQLGLPAGHSTHKHLDAVLHASRSAADLCRHLLAYAGRSARTSSAVDLGTTVSETINLLRHAVEGTVDLRLDLAHGLPSVHADATQLQQIIVNLVTNAAQAIVPPGPGVVTVTTGFARWSTDLFASSILSPQTAVDAYVFLQIADNGAGMDEPTLNRMCQPFFSTKSNGRGLGLAAVHGIVRNLDGALVAHSKPGAGTTFRVYLPVVQRIPVASPAAPAAAAAAAAPGGRDWVLIIDDEEPVRLVLAELMKTLRLEPVAVETAEAVAAELASRPAPAVVFLDATMPGVDTTALAVSIKSRHPALRIVLMSGYTNLGTKPGARHAAFDGFLQKPFTLDEILRVFAAFGARSSVPAGPAVATEPLDA